LRPARAAPSGIIVKAAMPAMSSALAQPNAEISVCPSGSMANWPNEPQAPAMPTARLRFSGG
jgi:hypothetical protein